MFNSFVSAAATGFRLNDSPFPVTGVNCYFLAYCSDTARRSALAIAKQMGARVIRSWAFLIANQQSPGSVAFQIAGNGAVAINDGPDGLERLDALIKAAEDLDLKLILPLVNHWDALGGMSAYVNCLSPGSDGSEFYRQPAIKDAYKTWVSTILTRRNTLTGRLYSDEPAIMAWELTNEARCPVAGGRETLLAWITEMAAFVKAHDANHLLALGDEGFFYKQSSGHLYDGTYGVDWVANLAVPYIDFGTFHFYPQDWGFGKDLNIANRWIRDHVTVARRLNKPVLMEEFGLKLDTNLVPTAEDRDGWFANWLDSAAKSDCAGQLLWMLGYAGAAETKGFVDDYVIYDPTEVPSLAEFSARSRNLGAF